MEVTAVAPPAEAHARIAYALTEIRRYLVPVSMAAYRIRLQLSAQVYELIAESRCYPLKQRNL